MEYIQGIIIENENGGESERPRCPRCQNERVVKHGFRYLDDIKIQNYRCKNCSYRFNDPIKSLGFSGSSEIDVSCQVCDGESKNLIVVPENGTTGEISETDQLITKFMMYLRKTKKNATVESQVKLIKQLIRKGANLEQTESVENVIAFQKCTDGRKRNFVHAYSNYLKMQGKTWEAPKYESENKIPWVPSALEVDQLIAGCNQRHGAYLQLLKETGARRGEAFYQKWTDLDLNTKEIRITPEKRSNPRKLRLSEKLVAMLNKLPRKNQYVFGGGNVEDFSQSFRNQRNKTAFNLGNDNIKRINFKSLRHYKGTSEYLKTGDIYHVKRILGHKMIKNTEIYIQTAGEPGNVEWVSGVASTKEEAMKFIDNGFEYALTTPDNFMIFRKRK